ncbi:hypothetical protein C943_00121 [Mariniradius saccharolyticus AK6]|uniref:Uncharacterized protein n=1 Tax=Mariniradius saccharolyticus AK6 TaxID=1239962 RepID=M7XLK4_9BACT|nr:hypothetical protein C943_00121 [Mariniradius saccharolyticus AK6]
MDLEKGLYLISDACFIVIQIMELNQRFKTPLMPAVAGGFLKGNRDFCPECQSGNHAGKNCEKN